MPSMPSICLVKYGSELFAQPPLVSSAAQAWPGLLVQRYQLPAMALPAHYHQQHLLLLHQPPAPVATRRQLGRRVEEAVFQTGDLGLHPGGEYGAVAWSSPQDTTHLYLDQQYLENLAGQRAGRVGFTLRGQFRFADPLLTHLGRQLLGAASTPPALGLGYVEALTQALCMHLLEHYATPELAPRRTPSPQLPPPVLARIDAYLEAHASAPITLAALASLANLSVFHFAYRFKLTLGVPPYQYVLGWRIRRAQALLRAKQLPVAAIGDALGFATPAHFAAAFKRVVGCSLRAYREK